MTSILFLLEWALRSSILIAGGALLLAALRVKDPAVRLAAWTAILCSSLLIPALREGLPKMPVSVPRSERAAIPAPPASAAVSNAGGAVSPPQTAPVPLVRRFDWPLAALAAYALGSFLLLLRLAIGLTAGFRLLRKSESACSAIDGIEIRQSPEAAAPLTLGILRPAIVLPANWREWEGSKLDAVLAHESSHVRRFDPAVQLLSAIHRALLWHSPLSWFLHQRIVRIAEEASDDAALSVTHDRPSYAQILMDFMRGPVGVPMARYGDPERRIHRILEGTVLSKGLTRWSAAAILTLACPLAYLAGAIQPRTATPARTIAASAPQPQPQNVAVSQSPIRAQDEADITALGMVASLATVTVTPRIDGQLMSVDFKEGEPVRAGQLLATIDPRPFEPAVAQAKSQVEQDQAALRNAQADLARLGEMVSQKIVGNESLIAPRASMEQINAKLIADQAGLDRANLLLSYTQVMSPITGVAGLRKIDPGNIVHPTDSGGIVVITQLQPIGALFDIIEDRLPEVLARLRSGTPITVEAWSRDFSRRLAIGRLTAVDNQIDVTTGTAKLKAVFDNKDGALMNGAFVNGRIFLDR